jgi:hypothetical protein
MPLMASTVWHNDWGKEGAETESGMVDNLLKYEFRTPSMGVSGLIAVGGGEVSPCACIESDDARGGEVNPAVELGTPFCLMLNEGNEPTRGSRDLLPEALIVPLGL